MRLAGVGLSVWGRLVGGVTALALGLGVIVAAGPAEATSATDQTPRSSFVGSLGFGWQEVDLLESVRAGVPLAQRASEARDRSSQHRPDLAAADVPASLTGRVTAPDGSPADDVCVAALDRPPFSGEPVASSVTGSDGRYSLDVPAGIYRVLFVDCSSPPRFAYTYLNDASSFSEADPVLVESGQQLWHDVALRPGARIEGAARLAGSGTQVAGICVGVTDEQLELIDVAVTGPDGSYVVGGLRSREYQVLFLDCREQPTLAMQWWDRQHAVTRADRLTVDEGAVRVGIDAALQPAGRFAGRLVDQHGEGVDGACVAALDRDEHLYAAETTRSDGTYLTQTLPAGQYIVLFADCHRLARFQPAWYPSGDLADAVDVAITPGTTTTGVDATIVREESDQLPPDLPPSDDDICDQAPSDHVFTDTAGNTHADAIECIAGWRITLGTGDGRFAPQSTVRRDQLASFLARMLETVGQPLPDPGTVTFADVGGNVHQEAIEALAAAGIVLGTSPSTYNPAGIVRRDQMASFLTRAIEFATATELPDVAASSFTDTHGNIHARNIDRLSPTGIVLGTTPSTYSPAGQVRRDQMASFLARSLRHLTIPPVADELTAAAYSGAGWASGGATFRCYSGGRIGVTITTYGMFSDALYHRIFLGRARPQGGYDWAWERSWTPRLVGPQHGLITPPQYVTERHFNISHGRWVVYVQFASRYQGSWHVAYDRAVWYGSQWSGGQFAGILEQCVSPSGQVVL
jgi:hypothetical protein